MSLIKCPNCEIDIYVETIACGIYRCGVFRTNGQPIPPHAPKVECEFYVNNQLIYGCGSPFKYNGKDPPEICNYI
jgi:hypothetical protein